MEPLDTPMSGTRAVFTLGDHGMRAIAETIDSAINREYVTRPGCRSDASRGRQ